MSEIAEYEPTNIWKVNPGGRPTKLTKQVYAKAYDYLENPTKYGKNLPSVARLAQVLDVTEKTLYNWADKPENTKFLQILEAINRNQKIDLLENGLSGKYNSNITKLVLGKHGYHDKQDINQTQVSVSIGDNELARRLAYVLAKGSEKVIEGEKE